MSDLQVETEEVTEVTLEDFAPEEDGFCHIDDGSDIRFFCGKLNEHGRYTCKPYNGEAICPSCGKPTCPTCAVRGELDERLEYGS